MTEIASERDACLRKSADVLKKDPRCAGSAVKIEYDGNRGVTINGIYAYDQKKGNDLGEFVPPYGDLKLP